MVLQIKYVRLFIMSIFSFLRRSLRVSMRNRKIMDTREFSFDVRFFRHPRKKDTPRIYAELFDDGKLMFQRYLMADRNRESEEFDRFVI